MTDFAAIPNKRPVTGDETATDLWPEMGPEFVLNKFYSRFASSEGWLGKGYLAAWTREEVQSFREPNLEAYPAQYHFFASDGGGTQFGFCNRGERVDFISAPDIGSEDDIRVLGSWEQLLLSVETGDYI